MKDYIKKSDIIWCLTREDIIGDFIENYGIKLSEEDIDLARKLFSWGFDPIKDITYNEINFIKNNKV
jgi:hypothetical protein